MLNNHEFNIEVKIKKFQTSFFGRKRKSTRNICGKVSAASPIKIILNNVSVIVKD